MSINLTAFYSIIAIISTFLVGFGIFISGRKHFSHAAGNFFKNYIIGFFILGLAFTLNLSINLGVKMAYPLYLAAFLISQFGLIFSHFLFYRGTIMLDSDDNFRVNIFPLLVLPVAVILTMLGSVIAQLSSFTMFTIIRWGFIIPIKSYLAAIFLYYFFKGSRFDTVKGEFHTLFLGFIWLVSLGMELYLWFTLAAYPQQEFWNFKMATMTGWYILRAVMYWLTLAAILLYSNWLNRHQSKAQ